MRKQINLALQGGGAHGAFTWGVLDAFLEEDRFEVAAISGASAGAMNAAIVADGLREGGESRAREKLAAFWRAVSSNGAIPDSQRHLLGAMRDFWDPFQVTTTVAEKTASFLSPYQFNPLDINPLRAIVNQMVDFAKLRETNSLKLFIAATNVHTGRVRIFQRPELTLDMVMASACLPTVFKAVEVEGQPYWDGGYMGNPPLFPFFSETDCEDVVLVQINPIERKETPHTVQGILDRLNEITFNAPLLQEFRAVDFVSRLKDAGRLEGTHYKKVRMHVVEGGHALEAFSASTKMSSDYSFFQKLFGIGRKAGEQFIAEHFDAIGVYGTLEMKEMLI